MGSRMNWPKPILLDARNWDKVAPDLASEISNSYLIGFDIETQDEARHPGLTRLMKVDAEGHKGKTTKLVFDTNRTVVTGFSLYCDKSEHAYYVNLAHADVKNRLPWEEARELLNARAPDATLIAHKAPFEITMMKKSLGYDLGQNIICTLQLAVSLFNPDTYSYDDFATPSLGEIPRLFPAIQREFALYQPGMQLTNAQEELFYKVVAKESDAKHSYLGYIKELTWGYGLKGLTKRFLGYKQTTFEEVLAGRAHMGQLTGDEVVAYGADDAWCAVWLYHALLKYGMEENPAVIKTFFEQENPMIHVYSQVWGHGVNIDLEAVKERRDIEREKIAGVLRTMKGAVRRLLPFPTDVHEKLVKYDEKFYGKSWQKYRDLVTKWAKSPDSEDDFEQLYQVRLGLSTQFAEEKGLPKSPGISLVYYQVVRCILLDLCRCSFQLFDGKIQSDADAQEIMKNRLLKKGLDSGDIRSVDGNLLSSNAEGARILDILTVLDSYRNLASADTTIRMFINAYLNLNDPDTGKVYPVLSSQLNTRRMALESPNLSQLSKYSYGAYVRRFFLPDKPRHVILSMDWSGVELVLIGEESRDPEFTKVFGQLPHGDLHSETAASLLQVSVPEFKARPDKKEQRNLLGKIPNFDYWYSGALGTAAKALHWASEKMWEETDKYRTKYSGAEAWRVGVIQNTKETGLVVLKDHHTRVRFESTYTWANLMRAKFENYGETISHFGELVIKKLQTRSGNQAVNFKIQGGCATLAKRSILRMEEVIPYEGWDARFIFPVHDELVYSVDRDIVWEFKERLWGVMCNHPDLVQHMQLDATAAIGLNYQAYHEKTNPKGQIELSELSPVPFLPKERWGKMATKEEVEMIVKYLFDELVIEEKQVEYATN